jgi:hypothetical protein
MNRSRPEQTTMQIELLCPHCACRLTAPPDASVDEVFDRMLDAGPHFLLGDGATFEDMIFNSLIENGQIVCPECGESVQVSEESISQMAMEVLAQW